MTSPAPARRRPEGRYDAPANLGGKAMAVVLAALFVAFVLTATWLLFSRYGQPDVRHKLVRYQVQSDSAVEVEFEVAAEPGKQVQCVVRSRNAAGAEVGREVVDVGAVDDGDRVLRFRHLLETTDRPVTGEVQRCALVGGPQRLQP